MTFCLSWASGILCLCMRMRSVFPSQLGALWHWACSIPWWPLGCWPLPRKGREVERGLRSSHLKTDAWNLHCLSPGVPQLPEEPPHPASSLLSRCCAKVVMPSSPSARTIKQCHTWPPWRAPVSPGTLQCQEGVKKCNQWSSCYHSLQAWTSCWCSYCYFFSFQKYHPENVNCWNTVLLLA